jgi:hypothetical protein
MSGLPSLYSTTTASSAFLLNSDGYVVGTYLATPATRYQLDGGVVASTQATPLYGGNPLTITVTAPSHNVSSGLGNAATLATSAATLDAWCLFDQASAGIITPFSAVPLYYANQSLNYVLVGSGARVVLPLNPSALNTIANGQSNQAIYWNATAGYVDIVGAGSFATPLGYQIIDIAQNSKTVSYSAGPPITANWVANGYVIVVRV